MFNVCGNLGDVKADPKEDANIVGARRGHRLRDAESVGWRTCFPAMPRRAFAHPRVRSPCISYMPMAFSCGDRRARRHDFCDEMGKIRAQLIQHKQKFVSLITYIM